MRPFRLRDIVPDTERDVAEELRFHLDMRAEEMMQLGMSPEEARRKSAESFGDVSAVEAECRVVRGARTREHGRRRWWQELQGDARYALRTLRRSPLFAVTAVLTLALGVGGAVGGFTLVNGVLLRPLPYHEPDRLAMIWMTGWSGNKAETQWPLSIPNFLDLKERTRVLSGIAAFRAWPYALRGEGMATASEIVPSARVSPELFDVLGVRPQSGRTFVAEDGREGSARVAVISESLWRRRFNRSPNVLGKHIELSGADFTVIGVMPAGFSFPRGAELPGGFQFAPRTELWTPLVFSARELTDRGTGNLAAVTRLNSNTTLDAARADLSQVLARLIKDNPRYFAAKTGITASTLAEQAAAPVRRGLWLLMGAVAVVLLIACLNIANLLVARASNREHEFAVRRALGASRSRVLRQLVTENVLLAVGGATVGFAGAAVATRLLVARMPAALPRGDDVVADWRVVLLAVAIAIGAGVAFGIVNAWHDSGHSADIIRGGARTVGRTRRTGRRLLVTLEVALSLGLLVGAGLLLQSYVGLTRVSPGFTASGAMTATLLLPVAGSFDQQRDGGRWTTVFEQYERRLNDAPGVLAAGAISSLPLTGAVESTNFTVEGAAPIPDGAPRPSADYQVVTPGWFRAASVPLLAGRMFDSRDRRENDPVIIVSARLARAYWPGFSLSSVLGRRLSSGLSRNAQTIIGIAGDVLQTSLDAPSKPVMYLPQAQFPYPFLSFVVRAKNESAGLASLLPVMRAELRAIDPALALDAVRPLQDVLDASVARQRFGMLVTGGFALAALLLAMIGLYGVIATGVAERTREIGVRVALGATHRDVLASVMKEGLVVTAVGTVAGTAVAFGATRLLQDQLFAQSVTVVPVYLGVALVTVIVAVLATLVPAWAAMRLDPVRALRGG